MLQKMECDLTGPHQLSASTWPFSGAYVDFVLHVPLSEYFYRLDPVGSDSRSLADDQRLIACYCAVSFVT